MTGASEFPYPPDDPGTIRGLGAGLSGASSTLDGALGDVTVGRQTITDRWRSDAGTLAAAEVQAIATLGEKGVTALDDAQGPLDDYAGALETARDTIDGIRGRYDAAQDTFDDGMTRVDANDDLTAAQRSDDVSELTSTRDAAVTTLRREYDEALETLRNSATTSGAALTAIAGRISPAPHSRNGDLARAAVLDILPFMSRRNGFTVTRVGNRVIVDTGNGNDDVRIRVDPATGEIIVTVNGTEHRYPAAGPDGRPAAVVIRTNGGSDVIDVEPGTTVGFTLLSGAGNDLVAGAGGNDVIGSGAGNDDVIGGRGRDLIDTGDGDDNVHGGAFIPTTLLASRYGRPLASRADDGNDIVGTGRGNDSVMTGARASHIETGEGDDRVSGGAGNDTIHGGRGNDTIHARGGNDTVFGDDGDDTLHGGDGDDTAEGGRGNDGLDGGHGNDTLRGGEGNDAVYGWSGNDTLHGGAGDDTVDGGDGDDRLHGEDGDDRIRGGDGNDTITTGLGDNVVNAGGGNDAITAGAHQMFAGDNIIHGDGGDDTITIAGGGHAVAHGGDGNDTITGTGASKMTVYGDSGDDSITLDGTGINKIDGGEGNDTITSGSGTNEIRGGRGNDVIRGGDGSDEVYGGEGNDTIDGGAGNDYIGGGSGNDTLRAGGGDDTVYAGEGDDTVDGGAGNDYIDGFRGDDIIDGGEGNDILSGGKGHDNLQGGAGNDVIYTGHGSDLVTDAQGVNAVYHQGDDSLWVNNTTRRVVVEVVDVPHQITVQGSPEFRQRVLADLETLASSPTGRELLERLGDESDHAMRPDYQIRIREYDTDNGMASPRYGETVIKLNPEEPLTDGRPITMTHHELIHAYHNVADKRIPGDYTGPDPGQSTVANTERQTVGLGIDHDNNPRTPDKSAEEVNGHPDELTENALRAEMGLPRRNSY